MKQHPTARRAGHQNQLKWTTYRAVGLLERPVTKFVPVEPYRHLVSYITSILPDDTDSNSHAAAKTRDTLSAWWIRRPEKAPPLRFRWNSGN